MYRVSNHHHRDEQQHRGSYYSLCLTRVAVVALIAVVTVVVMAPPPILTRSSQLGMFDAAGSTTTKSAMIRTDASTSSKATTGGMNSTSGLALIQNNQQDVKPHSSVTPPGAPETTFSTLHHTSSSRRKNSNKNSTACVTPEMIGHWRYVEFPNFTNPHCCDRHLRYPWDHEFCGHQNYSELALLKNHTMKDVEQGSRSHLAFMQGEGCGKRCRGHFHDHYVWQSPNLPNTWNPTEFCQLLGPTRRIVMMGDSTMAQASSTLMNAVHGWCQTQLAFYVSDTLIHEKFSKHNQGRHWLTIARNQSIVRDGDIVVLTVGAHLATKHQLYNVSQVVLEQITAMKEERPSVIVVYKTQQPGGCTQDIADLTRSPLEVGANFVFEDHVTYNQPLLYEYDKSVIRRLQERSIPFLDMRMLFSRSDAHPASKQRTYPIDCLHFCSPGPLDMFAILFLQLLRNDFAVSQCVGVVVVDQDSRRYQSHQL